jgi:hypothetical protein
MAAATTSRRRSLYKRQRTLVALKSAVLEETPTPAASTRGEWLRWAGGAACMLRACPAAGPSIVQIAEDETPGCI